MMRDRFVIDDTGRMHSSIASFFTAALFLYVVALFFLLLPTTTSASSSTTTAKKATPTTIPPAQRHKLDRKMSMKRETCERTVCAPYHRDEGQNCANKCVSEACYEEVYANEPLEDGEIDHYRGRLFTYCVQKELQAETNRLMVEQRAKKANKG